MGIIYIYSMKNQLKNNNNNILSEFSANLQKAVTNTGLTPYALAKKIGIDKQTISRLLKGDRDPNLTTVIRIAKDMRVSMDQLLGLTPAKAKAEVEVKKENLNLIDKISVLHEQDVELLEAIIGVLEKRRARTIAKFLNTVRDAKSSIKSKENFIGKTAEKVRKQQTSKVSSGSDSGDDEFEDDFDDFDDFEEDNDTSESDDFDEDNESDDYDEDENYGDEDDYDDF